MQLVTLMISFLISTLVMTGIISWYQVSNRFYSRQRVLAGELNDIYTTQQFLTRDIQASGYRGCRTRDPTFPLYRIYNENNEHYKYLRFNRSAFAFKASAGECYGKMPESACQRVKEDSIVLILYNIPQKINKLKVAMKDPESDIMTEAKGEIWDNSLVLISDCRQGDLFIATQVLENKLLHENIANVNNSRALSKAYAANAEMVELQTVAYYIGHKANHGTKYALFRDDFLHHADELLPEIVSLDIDLGIFDAHTLMYQYKPAEAMKQDEWPKVRTIRVSLKSATNRSWIHEIALRNGNGFDLGLGDSNSYFRAVDAHFEHKSAVC